MVFCDKCNICVHQACYGITSIPSGPWLCRTCNLNITPKCELCPSKGGAMKATKSGKLWAHVSCALWIPEVSIGCVEKMEPITKISRYVFTEYFYTCLVTLAFDLTFFLQFFAVFPPVVGISCAFYARIVLDPVSSVQSRLVRWLIT